MEFPKEPKVKSLAKAMRVLECFKSRPEMGVTEISGELGLYKSNVYDILSTFEMLGYVTQNERNGKYTLSYKVLELSHVITNHMGFRVTVYPHMLKLAQDTGETVYLAVPDGLEVVYLDAAYPGNTYITRSMLGERAHMYCTGIGKAMLSRLDPTLWEQVARQPKEKFTENTILDPARMMRELEAAKSRGYAVDNMEHEYGVKCVGVAVCNSEGRTVAGVSISGPSPRFEQSAIENYALRLKDIAREIAIYF